MDASEMTDHRLREVVIVGGGTAGWMCAAAFSRFLANGYTRIRLVESAAIGTVGVGEATVPTINQFNHLLRIDEAAFLRASGGTYKLGIEFVDWGAIGQRYLHPFGGFGQPFEGIEFHQVWAKLRAQRRAAPLADYSIGTAAAAAGRFTRQTGDPNQLFSRIGYAFHFDAARYAAFLRAYAERGRVERIEGRIDGVIRDEATGHVSELVLDDGRRIAGELFVDCSGFRSLLLGEAMGVPFDDWSGWLPCNRALAVPTAPAGPPPPFTRATARPAGWQWRIPLQHRTGNGLVYCDAFLSRDAAEAMLLEGLDEAPDTPPRTLSFTAGRRARLWEGNVVGLGLAGGFLEPLESTSIHLIQIGILKLLNLLPDKRFGAVERDEYNRQMARSIEAVRDFVILHYRATTRDDTPFWRHVRALPIPDSLAARLDLFRARGRFTPDPDALFEVASWVAVCHGQGVVPDGYDPLVDGLDDDRLAGALDAMRRTIAGLVAAMPPHAAFLRAIGAVSSA